MTLKELVDQLQVAMTNGASAHSPICIEGHDDNDELIQRELASVTTERRCEDDEEPQAVYLNLGEE